VKSNSFEGLSESVQFSFAKNGFSVVSSIIFVNQTTQQKSDHIYTGNDALALNISLFIKSLSVSSFGRSINDTAAAACATEVVFDSHRFFSID